MDTRRSYGVGLGLVALSAAASALAYPELPARMVAHRNAAGKSDGETSRLVTLALLPALSTAVLGLFAVLPRIDPLGESVAALGAAVPAYAVVLIAVPLAAIAAYMTVYSYVEHRRVTA